MGCPVLQPMIYCRTSEIQYGIEYNKIHKYEGRFLFNMCSYLDEKVSRNLGIIAS